MKSHDVYPATVTFADELCLFYLRIEDYEHASGLAGKILSDDASNYTACLVSGLIEEEKGNYRQAILHYNSILKSYPDDPTALKRIAAAEAGIEEEESAFRNITRSLQLNNNDAEAYIIRGQIYFHLFQKKIEAIMDYNQALRIEPDNVHALCNRGFAYLKYGNRNYARDDFEHAARLGYSCAFEMLNRYFVNEEGDVIASANYVT